MSSVAGHVTLASPAAADAAGHGKVIASGLMFTVAFYAVAPRLPGLTEFMRRYFCGHPLEYITTGMFFVALSILLSKLRVLRRERVALECIRKFRDSGRLSPRSAAASAAFAALSDWCTEYQGTLRLTAIHRRISETLHYVGGRQQGGLENHLRYLAELASERLHLSYAMMRTITWAVPILGFLGTVIGITMAIANVTPEQLESSLPEVTGGLAVAFDTTAQALGISLVLVFGAFLVERGEQAVLSEVEQFGIDHLLNWLSTSDAGVPEAEPSVAVQAAAWTRDLLRQQTQSWGQHLQELQSGWTSALAAQTQKLSAALNHETQSTLEVHRGLVNDASCVWGQVLETSTQNFAREMQEALDKMAGRIDAWHNALQVSSLASAQQSEELHRLGRTLLTLTESEQRLTQLQQQLNDNIQGIRVVETLEQTLSSLNAAVNVLTAKTHMRSAA